MFATAFSPTTELFVDETVSNLEALIGQTEARVDAEPLPVVVADRTLLGQVFQNLLSNGIKFTAAGVTPCLRVTATREPNAWRFSITDNGVGVEPQYAERIFRPFKRLHAQSEFPGSGLGLSVCKRAVERRGGRIWVKPAPDGGSMFNFTIPDAVVVEDAGG